jgi:hypothetical protein
MTTFNQGMQTGEFLLSEAEGMLSRDQVTVTIAGSVALPSGTVLGKITASGKYVAWATGLGDTVGGVGSVVLYTPLPGVNGDVKATVISRSAEVIGSRLNNAVTVTSDGIADLLASGIIVR